MTDRHAGYVVVLEKSIRDDDAQATQDALSMVRGVLTVTPIVATPEIHIARERAYAELRERVMSALWPKEA